MLEWLTLNLSDFLLFSERVYWRLFVLENAALWPLPVLMSLTMIATLAFWSFRPDPGLRLINVILAIASISVGWHFVWQRYAPINWAMLYLVPLFFIQAFVLGMAALSRAPLTTRNKPSIIIGSGLILIGTVCYPWLAPFSGRTISSAEVFAIAPDPTSVVILGTTFLMARGWKRNSLALLSMFWIGQSSITLLVLDPVAALMPAAILAAGMAGSLLVSKTSRPEA